MSRDVPAPNDPARPDQVDVTIDVEQHGRAVVLRVAGELDMLTSPRLQDSIGLALRDEPEVLVIDLDGVTFLSSSAMSVLVGGDRVSTDRTAVRLVSSNRETLRPLELVGLVAQLDLHPTLDSALAP